MNHPLGIGQHQQQSLWTIHCPYDMNMNGWPKNRPALSAKSPQINLLIAAGCPSILLRLLVVPADQEWQHHTAGAHPLMNARRQTHWLLQNGTDHWLHVHFCIFLANSIASSEISMSHLLAHIVHYGRQRAGMAKAVQLLRHFSPLVQKRRFSRWS